MGDVLSFESKRVEVTAAGIRARLVDLRRTKAIRGNGKIPSARDPMLNHLLVGIVELRGQLAREIAQIKTAPEAQTGDELAILAMAQAVLADTAEMIELLKWLGAELPSGEALSPNSADR